MKRTADGTKRFDAATYRANKKAKKTSALTHEDKANEVRRAARAVIGEPSRGRKRGPHKVKDRDLELKAALAEVEEHIADCVSDDKGVDPDCNKCVEENQQGDDQ